MTVIERTGNRLNLVVEGPSGAVPLSTFIDALEEALAILRELDSALSHRPRGALEWVVSSLSSNGTLAAEVEPRLRPEPKRRARNRPAVGIGLAAEVSQIFLGGLRVLEHEGTLPAFFSEVVTRKVGELAKVTQHGADGFRAHDPARQLTARVTAETAANVQRATATKLWALGSVTGTLEMISVHRGDHFNVYESLTKKAVKCIPEADVLEEAKTALGRRVRAHGMVARNMRGEAVRLRLQRLEVLDDGRVVEVDQLIGADPEFTDGKTTDDYLRDLREG